MVVPRLGEIEERLRELPDLVRNPGPGAQAVVDFKHEGQRR